MSKVEGSIASSVNTMLVDAIIRSNSVEEANVAIRLGADVNALSPVEVVNNGVLRRVNITPLMASLAIQNVDYEIVHLLIENGADPAFNVERDHYGTIHHAAAKASTKVLSFLATCPAVDVNVPDRDGLTPLVYAIIAGNTPNMRTLLDAGAKVDYAGPESIIPVVEAVKRGNDAALSVLFEYGAEVNVKDSESASPLHYAAMLGNVTITKMLIRKKADLEVRDGNMQTPLLRACMDGKSDIAKELVSAGADINVSDASGMTPLMFAVKASNTELAKYLIEKSVNLRSVDAKGFDALTYAYARGNKDLIELLRDGSMKQLASGEKLQEKRKAV